MIDPKRDEIHDLDAIIRDRFLKADWGLRTTQRPKQEFHPYPARFITALPSQVISLLDIKTGPVLDPFCGSGTTLFAARNAGLSSVGVDINPIACLISRVRTSRWNVGDGELLQQHAKGLSAAASSGAEVGNEFKHIPRLDHWFAPHAQAALSGAVQYANALDIKDPWRDRVMVSISAATVRISKQDSDTRYAAVDKAGDQATAARSIHDALLRTGNWLSANNTHVQGDPSARVVMGDAQDLSFVQDESIQLACFSPPYPNAYEYWLYHKYRMYWLGFDATEVRKYEMGARPHYSKPNGLTEVDFARQMGNVFGHVARALVPKGYACVVVGDSVIGGRVIDNGDLLAKVAVQRGFKPVYAGTRPIATSKSSFNRAHSRGRRSEHVLLFRRD